MVKTFLWFKENTNERFLFQGTTIVEEVIIPCVNFFFHLYEERFLIDDNWLQNPVFLE